MVIPKNSRTFALAFEIKALEIDSLAQQVEHNTFNVGVMGSSPMRVTVSEKGLSIKESPFFVSINFLLRIYKILLSHLQIFLYIPPKVLSATGGYKYGTGG